MKKLTKEMIEELGNKVVNICVEKGYGDTSVYFNGKRVHIGCGELIFDDDDDEDGIGYHYKDVPTETIENCHPCDYFEYFNENHILSMSFEGILYDYFNYGDVPSELNNLFEEYGIYYELGNSWNLSVYPIDDDMEVEGMKYKRKSEPIYIYRHGGNNHPELQRIMDWWYEESKKTGDIGSCVLGAGFRFNWNGDEYFMSACSPWQGSISWETHKDAVKKMLEEIGVTEIYYDWGRID